MTEQELGKVPFRFQSHMSMETEHTLTYISDNGRLGYCIHTPYRNGRPCRSYTHYRIDGNVYKSKAKFIEALKDYNP